MTNPEKPFRLNLAAETPDSVVLSDDLNFLEPYAVHLPMLGSYKIDGIRAINRGGLVSRTMKSIRSAFAREQFGSGLYEGLDGELIVPPTAVREADTLYHATESAVMTVNDRSPLLWMVFDKWNASGTYIDRQLAFQEQIDANPHEYIRILEQRLLVTLADIRVMEEEALSAGHEGLILRRPDRSYKQGRSTFKEGGIIKLARRVMFEAEIIGFNEMMHNDNEATTDARGYTKRASHQTNLRPAGMLGSFVARHLRTGVVFNLGGKMDHTFRKYVHEHQSEFLTRIARCSSKPYGEKDLPRQPSWEGWRDPADMGGE